jgi:hypothetical protein
MAISVRAAGTWAVATTQSPAVTIPAGYQAGDLGILVSVWRSYTVTATINQSWTELIDEATGTTTTGVGVGSSRLYVAYKVLGSSETNPTLTRSGTISPGAQVIIVLQKGASESWDVAKIANAVEQAMGSTALSHSLTTTAAIAASDWVFALTGVADDSATFTRATSAISGGPTWSGNVVEYPSTHASSTTGNDIAADLIHRVASGAASSGASITVTATLSAAERVGSVLFRVRVTANPTSTGVARLSLASGTDPGVHTGHAILVRARVTSGAGTAVIRAALYEGANNRSGDLSSSALTTSLADYSLAIGTTEAGAITSYADLELRLWGYDSGGAALTFEVARLRLQIPEAPASEPLSVAGSITPTGVTFLIAKAVKGGAITPAATLARDVSVLKVGVVTPTGSAIKKGTTAYAGAIAPAGDDISKAKVLDAGSVTPAGTRASKASATDVGAITPTGALLRDVSQLLAGVITPTGVSLEDVTASFAGSITPAGDLTAEPGARLLAAAGSTTPTGTLWRDVAQLLEGAIAPEGLSIEAVTASFAGTITPTGTQDSRSTTSTQAVAGFFTPTGALVRKPLIVKAGAVTPTGSLIEKVRQLLAGVVTPTGTVSNPSSLSASGAITPAGTLIRTAKGLLLGAVTPTGALAHVVKALHVGAIEPVGTLLHKMTASLAGAITPTGDFITSSLGFVNGVASRVRRLFWTARQAVSFSWTSRVRALTDWTPGADAMRFLSSVIGPSGTLTKRPLTMLAGAIAPIGRLGRTFGQALGGSVTPTGTLTLPETTDLLAADGSVTPTGAVTRGVAQHLSGALVPVGDVQRIAYYQRAHSGAVAPAGALSQRVTLGLGGSITPTGAHTYPSTPTPVPQAVAGAVTPSGAPLAILLRQAAVTQLQFYVEAWTRPATSLRFEYVVNGVTYLTNLQVSPLEYHYQKIGNGNPVGSPPLQPGTTYQVRALATTAGGLAVTGAWHSFATSVAQVAVAGSITPAGGVSMVEQGVPNEVAAAGAITPTSQLGHFRGILVDQITDTSFRVTWYPHPDMTGQVEYADNAAFTNSKLTTLAATPSNIHIQDIGTGINPPALTPGTTYYFRILGTTAGGYTFVSATHTALTTGTAPVEINYTDYVLPSSFGGYAIDHTGNIDSTQGINAWMQYYGGGTDENNHVRLIFPGGSILKTSTAICIDSTMKYTTLWGHRTTLNDGSDPDDVVSSAWIRGDATSYPEPGCMIRPLHLTDSNVARSAFVLGGRFAGMGITPSMSGGTQYNVVRGFDILGHYDSDSFSERPAGVFYCYVPQDFEILYNRSDNQSGDFVRFRAAARGHVHHNYAKRMGRMAVTATINYYLDTTMRSDHIVEYNTFDRPQYWGLDVEPEDEKNLKPERFQGLIMRNNRFGCFGGNLGGGFFVIGGTTTPSATRIIEDIEIRDNVIDGYGYNANSTTRSMWGIICHSLTTSPAAANRAKNIIVSGNTQTTSPYSAPMAAVVTAKYIDGLVITNNDANYTGSDWAALTGCTSVTESGNT